MKNMTKTPRSLAKALLFAAASMAIVSLPKADAATYYWDVNGATAGTGGTGNWSGAFWTTTAGGLTATASATLTSSDSVNFESGGTVGTVTLGNNATINAINDSIGMTFAGSGNKISLNGTTPGITIGAVATTMSTDLGISASSTLTIAAGGSLSLSGVLSGSNGLTKAGAGLLTLSGGNGGSGSGYSGTLTLSAGTLKIANQSVLSRGTLAMSGGALVFDSGNTSYSVGMLTAGSAGAGYDIALVNNAGTPAAVSLSIGNSNNNLTGTYAGVFSGAGSLTVKNGATLTLSGANSYTGGTTINDGTLKLGADERLADTGTVTVNDSGNGGGTFDLNNHIETTATVSLTNSGGNNGSASIINGTLVVNGPATYDFQSGSVSASLTGSAVLNKTTSGIVILSGTNTYTGATSVTAGTLKLYKAASLYNDVTSNWAASSIKVSGGATLWVRVGGAGEFTSADLDVLLPLGTSTGGFLNNSIVAFDTASGDFTYGTVIGDTNAAANKLNVTKVGNNTLFLTANSTYTGVTTISGGTLSVSVINDGGVAGNIGAANGAAANIVLDGGTLKYTGSGETIARGFSVTSNSGTITASGTGALVLSGDGVDGGFAAPGSGSRTLTLRGTNTDLNIVAGLIVDPSSNATSLTKADTGTWVLTNANTFNGGTSVQGGTLRLHNQLALQNSTTTMAGSLANGGYLIFDQSVVANAFTVGALASASAGVGFDIVLMNNAGTPAPIVLTAGGNNATTTYAGVLSGQGQLVKRGSGVMTLTGTSTYTGATTIYAGKLSVSVINNGGVNGNLGAATSDPANLILDGGTLLYTGATASTDRNFTLGVNGGTIEANGSGAINFLGTPTIVVAGTRTLTLRGTNTGNNTLTGILPDSSAGATSLTKSDAGKWVLAGLNTYTGVSTITGGTLSVSVINNGGVAGNLGAATAAPANIVIDGGTLLYTGAGETTDRGFSVGANSGTVDASGTGALTFTGNVPANAATGARTLTLTGTNTGANTLTGVISNYSAGSATSLTKTGAGTWVLSGASTYTGVTTINAGTLSVSSLANGGSASNVGAAAVAASNLVINGGTLLFNGSSNGTTDRGFTVGANGATIDASGSVPLVITGNDAASGSGDRVLTLTGSNVAANRIGGVLVDPSSNSLIVTKTGAGTWVLSGANTYAGVTNVNAGTLVFANTLAAQDSTVVMAGGTLIFDASVGSGNFTVGGLSASSSGAGYDIALQNNAGTPAAVTLSIGNNNANTSYAGVLSGLGGIAKIGTGTLTLSAANTFASGTAVTGGTLKLANSLAVQNSTVTLNGGSVVFDSSVVSRAFTFGGLAASGTGAGYNLALQNNAGTPAAVTLTIGGNNSSSSYAGVLSGAGSLTKVGTGTLTLSGANTYSGATTVNAGTVTASSGSLSGTSGITVSAGTLNAVNFNAAASLNVASGATANVSGTGLTLSGVVTNNGTLNFTGNTGTITVGSIGGTTGTTTFSSNATVTSGISGGTVSVAGALNSGISGGTVSAGSLTAGAVSGGTTTVSGTANITTLSAGTVNLNGATASVGTLNGGTVNLGTTILSVGAGTSSGAITGANGSLVKTGAGSLTLTGANTFGGTTTVNGGSLTASAGSLSGTSGIVVNSGSLTAVNYNSAATLTVASGATATVSGAGLGGGAVTNNGTISFTGTTGTVTLAGLGGTGTTNFSADATIGGSGITGGVVNVAGVLNSVISGGIVTADSINSSSITGGVVTILNANAHAGGNVVSGGTVRSGDNAGISGGGLTVNGSTTLTSDGVTARVFTYNVALNSNVTLGAATTYTGDLTFQGNVDLGAGNRTIAADSTATISGVISNGSLTKAGASTLTLSGANTYAGTTTVSAGTLATTGSGVLSSTSGVTVASGATLQLGGAETINTLSNSGTIALAGGTLTTGGDNGSSTLGGSLAGTGTLVKAGTGTLTLATANNGFTGVVNVSAGTLSATGANALGTSSVTVGNGGVFAANASLGNVVTVNSGGMLKGSGSLGATAVNAGGILAPGNSPGLQTFSSLSLAGGSSVQWQVCNATGVRGTDYDSLAVTGQLSLAGASSANKVVVNVVSLAHNADLTPGNAVNFDSTLAHQFVFATYGSLDMGTNTNLGDLFSIDITSFLDSLGQPSTGSLWSMTHSGGTIYLNVGSNLPSGSILDPGNIPDFMNVANFTLTGTATLEVSGQAYAGVYNDVVNFTGVAALGGSTTVTIARYGSQPNYGQRYVLFRGTGSPANPTQVSSYFSSAAPGTVNTSDLNGRYLISGPAVVNGTVSAYDGLIHNADGLVHLPNEYAVYFVRDASAYNLPGIHPSLVSFVQLITLTGPGGPLENGGTVYIPGVSAPALSPLAARLMTMTDPQLQLALSSLSPAFYGMVPGVIASGQRSEYQTLGGELGRYHQSREGAAASFSEGFVLVRNSVFKGGSGSSAVPFDTNSSGVMGGLVRGLTANAVAGFSLSYDDSKGSQASGTLTGNAYRATAFVSTVLGSKPGSAYLDVGVSAGTSTSKSVRTTFLGAESAAPKTKSYGAFARLGLGQAPKAGFSVSPYLGLDYVRVNGDAFQESGDEAAMSVGAYHYDTSRATAGANVTWLRLGEASSFRCDLALEAFGEIGHGRTVDLTAGFGSAGSYVSGATVSSGGGVRVAPSLVFEPSPNSAYYLTLSLEKSGDTSTKGAELGYRRRF